jgi:hypothetical protein
MDRMFKVLVGAVCALVIAGCTADTPGVTPAATPIPPSPTTAPTAEPSPTPPSPTATAAEPSAPPPTSTPDPFPNPVLKITGEEEVVFDWTTDRCEDENIPDLAARAFRDADGRVQLLLSHLTNYRLVGPDLDTLAPDCEVLMRSDHAADPGLYNDNEWLAAPYTEDGLTVYALVHNEFQGHTHPGQCPQGEYFPCWDNSITLAASTDGGDSFHDAASPPGHLVARLPYPYEAGAGPAGARNPSNIIKGADGYYYNFFNVILPDTQQQWVCLMRSDDLGRPDSWRFWDGEGFDGQFLDPHANPRADPAGHLCPALALEQIGASLNEGITYNTDLERYVLIGLSADHLGGREVWGIYYAFSDDLVHWSRRKLLKEMPLPWTVADAGSDLSILYPTLMDPDSESRNFETTDRTAYLYYTRHNHGQGSLDRDLVRVPVAFSPGP